MKRSLYRPLSWPISLKMPLLVALLMIAIGSIVTERVLTKLSEIQDQNLQELSGAYLDGLSSTLLPHVLRDDTWEVFDSIERSKAQYENISVVSTIVVDPQNVVIAASDPTSYATGSSIPSDFIEQTIAENALEIRTDQQWVSVLRDMNFQESVVGRLMVVLDVSRQLAERDEVWFALIGSNAVLTFVLAAFGYLLTRRMTRPMQVLAENLDKSRESGFEEIAEADIQKASNEAAVLFTSYNSMVRATNERDLLVVNLHEEEKLAGLGRLAAVMAHEINNPLGGMLTSLETLKRHGDNPVVRKKSIGLLERGLKSIGDVVQTSLVAYRKRSDNRPLNEKDFADLRLLLRPELRRRAQTLDWDVEWNGEVPLDGTSVRQIGLNLLLNASEAAGQGGAVAMRSKIDNDQLEINVENDGKEIPQVLVTCLNANISKQTIKNGVPHSCASSCLRERGAIRTGGKNSVGIGFWVICRLVEENSGEVRAVRRDGVSVISVTIPTNNKAVVHAV